MFTPPDKTYSGYIFDCDGTLADSMPIHLNAWNHGLRAAGAPIQIDGKGFMSVAGMALQQTIDHWNRTHSIQINAEVVIREKNAYYAKHEGSIKPIPEVVAFLHRCRESGAAISVASGGGRRDVMQTLKRIGLEGVIPVVVTADDVAYGKPAPDLFLLAAKRMGVAPETCLVIEDSLLGIEAADIACMDSVLVPHAF